MRYYRQVQALDVEGAWDKVAVPTLIVWGEYDWIMGRDESERAVALLKARDPALVTYLVRRGMDHHFDVYADPRKAFAEEDGAYDAGAGKLIAEWLHRQTSGTPR
jgi:pimeloyl-ACP methyl ester carboxylesterase